MRFGPWGDVSHKLRDRMPLLSARSKLKPGFHYPSWRPELKAQVDGWPVSISRLHGPCWRAAVAKIRTCRTVCINPRPVNLASGNARPSTWPMLTGNGNRSPVNLRRQLGPSTRVVETGLYRPSCRASVLFGQYQVVLLSDRGTCVWTTCQESLHESEQLGAKAFDCNSDVGGCWWNVNRCDVMCEGISRGGVKPLVGTDRRPTTYV